MSAPITDALPLGELIDIARTHADVFGIRQPAATVSASEPLRFWSEENARQWLYLNGFALTGEPHDIGTLTVVPVQVGVYSLVAQWPSKEI